MITHLISTTNFVKLVMEGKDVARLDDADSRLFRISNYANFISQKLTLSMFIACDDEDNVLEEPEYHPEYGYSCLSDANMYTQAQSKILFKDYRIIDTIREEIHLSYNGLKYNYDSDTWHKDYKEIYTIEDLMGEVRLELTETALKNIWL